MSLVASGEAEHHKADSQRDPWRLVQIHISKAKRHWVRFEIGKDMDQEFLY